MAFPQKRALEESRAIVFCDQSGFYLLPMVVRTYTPWEGRPFSMSVWAAMMNSRR